MSLVQIPRRSAVALLLMLAAILFAATPSAAEVIDFDDMGGNQSPGTRYADRGIVFGDHFLSIDHTYGGAVAVPSGPIYLTITGIGTEAVITFVDPADPNRKATTDFFAFDNPGLTDQNATAFFDGLEIVLLDLQGREIGGTTIDPVGPPADGTRDIFQTVFAVPGIHQVVFTKITNPLGASGATPIDNFRFNAVTPVPAPASLVLLATGLIGLLGLRRRAHSPDRAPTRA